MSEIRIWGRAPSGRGDAWLQELKLGIGGRPKSIFGNALKALEHAPVWQGVFRFDIFGSQIVLQSAPYWDGVASFRPRPFDSREVNYVLEWLHDHDIDVQAHDALRAVEHVAFKNSFHPVREFLNNLVWDGERRLDHWLVHYLGVEPSEYHRRVGRILLISSVARIQKPGCKVDTIVCLEGEQGSGKSRAVRALYAPWFTDRVSPIQTKDAAHELLGMWGIEMAELAVLNSARVEDAKAFLTRQSDRYRKPYGRSVEDHPRQCVIICTTNENQYLRDATGNRRFLPVSCGTIAIEELEANRDQLFAEAVAAYRNGEPWWLNGQDSTSLAQPMQVKRIREDLLPKRLEQYLDEHHGPVALANIFESLGLPEKQLRGRLGKQVVRLLREKQYRRQQLPTDGEKRWHYVPPVFIE